MATKIIIGLGNPGEEYANARHNIGWMFLDWCAKKSDMNGFEFEKKLNAEITKGKIELNGKTASAILVKPFSYVNKSGLVASKVKSFFKVKAEDFYLIHDDMDIPFGKVKFSYEKNAAGHHGVESVFKGLKTKKFWRVRIGTANTTVKKAHQQSDKKRDAIVVDFVLGKFSPKEHDELKSVFKETLEQLAVKRQ